MWGLLRGPFCTDSCRSTPFVSLFHFLPRNEDVRLTREPAIRRTQKGGPGNTGSALSADGLRGRRLGSTNYPRQSQLDNERILAAARQAGRLVVVAENHTVIGGLGESVAALLMREGVTPAFRQIALPDEFLDAGALPTLHDRYGISTTEVVRRIREWTGK